jgi:hypothetical protein
LAKAERIADRDNEISDFKAIAVAELDCLQPVGIFHLQQSDVGRRVTADELGRELAAVLGRDLNDRCVGHHMIGGQHVAAQSVDDDA